MELRYTERRVGFLERYNGGFETEIGGADHILEH